ncbi:MAG: hypothetical protein U1F76_19390 [Candidatus Competibacteraceae bacterium]
MLKRRGVARIGADPHDPALKRRAICMRSQRDAMPSPPPVPIPRRWSPSQRDGMTVARRFNAGS